MTMMNGISMHALMDGFAEMTGTAPGLTLVLDVMTTNSAST